MQAVIAKYHKPEEKKVKQVQIKQALKPAEKPAAKPIEIKPVKKSQILAKSNSTK